MYKIYIYAYVCILLSSFFKSKCAYLTMYIHILYKVSQSVHIYIYIHMCFSRYKEISHSCCCYYCYYYSCMFMILMAIGFVWSEPLCIAKYSCVNGVWAAFWWANSPLNDALECETIFNECQRMHVHANMLDKEYKPPTTQPTTPIINSAVDTFRLIAPKYIYLLHA